MKKETEINLTPVLNGEVDSLEFDFEVNEKDLPSYEDIRFVYPIKVRGRVSNNAGYMRLMLDSDVGYETDCARCLAPVECLYRLSTEKPLAQEKVIQDGDNEDYLIITEGLLEVYIPFCEQLQLELPSKHLCREDCAGLCPKCGKDLNEGDCDCPKSERDPRWAVLEQLLESDQGSGSFTDNKGGAK